ncbi:MAG TPA: HAMP domain-containing sensor histidine kinase [Leptospiraceae bacterium]|nr:HAMP domain-containing sensor histidine kinase [Leptospiraceae bacterium]
MEKEEITALKRKSVYPNVGRLICNLIILIILYYSGVYNIFFYSIVFIIIFSAGWTAVEAVFILDYEKNAYLSFFPAVSDLLSIGILVYLTGSVNSWAIIGFVTVNVISTFFSLNTSQPAVVLTGSLIVYSSVCLAVLSGAVKPENLLNPYAAVPSWKSFFFSSVSLSVIQFLLYKSVSSIAMENKRLLFFAESERKKAEEARAEVEVLAESRKRLSMIGQTVSGIVHDIKNPISSIKAFAELMNDESLSEEKKDYLQSIEREAERLGSMTYEILDFSRGSFTLNLKKVSPQAFLEEIRKFIIPDFDFMNIRIYIICETDELMNIDSERLRRVFINMANNAREAFSSLRRECYLKIRAEKENGYFLFTVEDNGRGIPAEVKSRLFDAYSTYGKSRGTGLGLYMSKLIIEKHQGTVECFSEEGAGTRFIIRIPNIFS